VKTPANDNADNAPVYTLTRAQLEELIAKAVCQAMDRGIGGPVLIDKQDLARSLGCSASSIDRLRREGLPSVQLAKQVVRFEPAKVIEWLREHKQHA
jgi:predicted DNA-binding transcriptional regulator AlpA